MHKYKTNNKMLDRARKTVLAIINKENRGYLSPSETDLFFTQAQLEIFEDYFIEYTKWVAKANLRLSNSGYANMPKRLREKIEVFAEIQDISPNSINGFFDFPSDTYYINELYYNDIEVEEVDKQRMKYLKRANLTAPTEEYPAYTVYGRAVKVLPSSITTITCDYLRKPKSPKWTYIEVLGNPVFNISNSDFQDLEIHPSDEPKLITKVLSYVGISIREADIVKIMDNKNIIDLQKEKI